MSRPVPLMFVNGPPVYTHVPLVSDESTSLFVKEEEEPPTPIAETEAVEKVEVDPSILAQIAKVQTPIGQRVYQELTFVLDDEEIVGNVSKIEGNTIIISINGDETELIALELSELRNIIWRGKSLPEN